LRTARRPIVEVDTSGAEDVEVDTSAAEDNVGQSMARTAAIVRMRFMVKVSNEGIMGSTSNFILDLSTDSLCELPHKIYSKRTTAKFKRGQNRLSPAAWGAKSLRPRGGARPRVAPSRNVFLRARDSGRHPAAGIFIQKGRIFRRHQRYWTFIGHRSRSRPYLIDSIGAP
jgi:hypothetical protein